MKKIITGMSLGAVLATALFVPILIHERRAKFEFGSNYGKILGLTEAADCLGKEFGRYDGESAYRCLFSVKTTDVISLVTNGVKTVRVIP